MTEILDMRNIVKEYPMGEDVSTVLKGINLRVEAGEFIAILGPSGSGKSTLMNIIGLLDVPTSGEYYLSGKKMAVQEEGVLAQIRRREIGFIFQSFYLLSRQTAIKNVELPLIYAGTDKKIRHERAADILEKVGLKEKIDHFPRQLSGGQQQRVAIARALINNPTILLADEPTGALDQKTGRQVLELFQQLNEEGRTIIMITHDVQLAKQAKRVIRILDGSISEGVI
jgi:putative ABC transport system ATP-binding protein